MIQELYQKFLQHPTICTDTRNIAPNVLFFCLKGDNFNGNHFVKEALEKGAALVVTEFNTYKDHPKCFVVKDTLQTLQELAAYHRQQLHIPLFGITGTNGKTTTKELIVAVLKKKYKVGFTKGNLNNHIGVPLTLLSLTQEHEIAVIEMGANHVGEIDDLCAIAQPTAGVVTNVGRAHLEGFGSFENIIDTKMGLYRAVMNNAGTIFINLEDKILTEKLGNYPYFTGYGNASQSLFIAEIVRINPTLEIKLNNKPLTTQLIGKYNCANLLAAAAIGTHYGVAFSDVIAALSEYTPTNHRSQMQQRGTNLIIADYYNANPSSMQVALENLAEMQHENKMAILGDMFELGEESEKEHQKIIAWCKELEITCYFVGNHFFKAGNGAHNFFPDVAACNHYLQNNTVNHHLILIKGSRGIHLENIILTKSTL